jgi:hypothetical protein
VASAVRKSCGAIIRRSARPGHNRASATELPLARAIKFRPKRRMTSVEICLR